MKRYLYSKLLEWKISDNRKPLILRGARQVGKTYLLKMFGEQEYSSTTYLNFEQDPKLADFFKSDLKPASLIENISTYLNQAIQPENTLIIFDEIQESHEALNSLKYFYEQGSKYHIIAAGSLLGVKLANSKGFPVGKVNFLDLFPLNFFEFLDAIDKTKMREFLQQVKAGSDIPIPIHEELITLFKKYLFIGGMPEAVAEYVNTENLLSISKIQNEILDAYTLDFAKHAPKEEIMRITQVWESIPGQLAKENKKFIFAALRKSARGREYESAIQWLADAGLIYKSYNISTPKLPLSRYSNPGAFKVYVLDAGLLAAMCHVPPKYVVDDESLFSEFNGAFIENFVAQTLAEQHEQTYYWTSEGIAEVDFLVEYELKVFPLEVKSGMSRNKKSLRVYGEKYHPELLLRVSRMNLKKDGNILNLPLYLMSRLIALIS